VRSACGIFPVSCLGHLFVRVPCCVVFTIIVCPRHGLRMTAATSAPVLAEAKAAKSLSSRASANRMGSKATWIGSKTFGSAGTSLTSGSPDGAAVDRQ